MSCAGACGRPWFESVSILREDDHATATPLELQSAGRRYWVRRDGKYSTKVPEATATQIAERIRRWLFANT